MASRKGRNDCFIDRISNLPCNVMELILRCLPLRDVARTSVLCRQWRHKWLTISDLVFDLDFIDSLPKNYDVEYVVYQILLRHKGPIFKFVLKITKSIKHDAINNWLEYLAEHHHLRYLTLELWNYPRPCYVVPQCLFRFQHLQELHLKSVEVRLPPSFNGFNKLVILNLDQVHYTREALKTLISECPELMSLSFSSDVAMRLNVNAPNLRCLSVWGPCFLANLFQLAMLEKISMRGTKHGPSFRRNALDRLRPKASLLLITEWWSSAMPFIKEVEVDCWVLECWGVCDVPEKLPNSLHHLTHLKVNSMCLKIIEGVRIVICLIRSAPNLKCFHVSLDSYNGDNLASIQYLKAQQECTDPISCSLKSVKIENFDSDEHKMEFVKLLLSQMTALENLEIKSNVSIQADMGDMYKMSVKVNSFPRRSSKVVVMFD